MVIFGLLMSGSVKIEKYTKLNQSFKSQVGLWTTKHFFSLKKDKCTKFIHNEGYNTENEEIVTIFFT